MFGVRHAAYIIGSIFSLVSLYFLLEAGERVREVAEQLALLAVGVMFLLVIFSVVQLRERREFQGRMNAGPDKSV